MTTPFITPFPATRRFIKSVEDNVDPRSIYTLRDGRRVSIRSKEGAHEAVRWFDFVFRRAEQIRAGNFRNRELLAEYASGSFGEAGRRVALRATLIELQFNALAGYFLHIAGVVYQARLLSRFDLPGGISQTTRDLLTGGTLENPETGESYTGMQSLSQWQSRGLRMQEASQAQMLALAPLEEIAAIVPTFTDEAPKTMGIAAVAAVPAGITAGKAVLIVGLAAVAALTITAVWFGASVLSTLRPWMEQLTQVWQQNAETFERQAESCESQYAGDPAGLSACLNEAQERRDASNQAASDTMLGAISQILDDTLGELARTARSTAVTVAVVAAVGLGAYLLISRGD